MDLLPRKNLGRFQSLRQPAGYSTFCKHPFQRIQWCADLRRHSSWFWNRCFDPGIFLRSGYTCKVSNFWDGTGYCYVTTFKSDALVWFIVDRIEECLILRVTLSTTDPIHCFSSWLLLLEWDFLGHCIVWWQYKGRIAEERSCNLPTFEDHIVTNLHCTKHATFPCFTHSSVQSVKRSKVQWKPGIFERLSDNKWSEYWSILHTHNTTNDNMFRDNYTAVTSPDQKNSKI